MITILETVVSVDDCTHTHIHTHSHGRRMRAHTINPIRNAYKLKLYNKIDANSAVVPNEQWLLRVQYKRFTFHFPKAIGVCPEYRVVSSKKIKYRNR